MPSIAAPGRRRASRTRAGDDLASSSIFRDRLERARNAAGKHELSHLLVTNPLDVAYLTGFLGGDSYLLLAVSGSQPLLISDFRYEEELARYAGIFRVQIRRGLMLECVRDMFAAENVARCGVQAETMTLAERDALGKLVGIRKLANTKGIVAELRRRKDPSEIALIRKAVKIQEQSLLALLPTLKPGQTELQVAARLEAEMKSRGSSAPSFETIIAARANGSLPHYRPGPTKLAKNQPLLIDWGAIWQGYHSDMTRTFTLGRWPARVRDIYTIVLEAHELAAAALAPGRTTREIDSIARMHIAKAGFGEYFGHGLGHGIGFNTHEDPRLSHMTGPTALEPGHVVTIEPGIYLPGIGGVRIEDDYAITESGVQRLCSLPRDINWATLA